MWQHRLETMILGDARLERLGLPADACAFVDDNELNCDGARDAGLHAVHFRSTDQAIAELDALLGR